MKVLLIELAILVVIGIALFIREIPELRRYLRMRSM